METALRNVSRCFWSRPASGVLCLFFSGQVSSEAGSDEFRVRAGTLEQRIEQAQYRANDAAHKALAHARADLAEARSSSLKSRAFRYLDIATSAVFYAEALNNLIEERAALARATQRLEFAKKRRP